jgi:DNA-directed RNA polymerase specialized sigma24 family protein
MPKAYKRPEYGNAQIKALIMEHIHDKVDRRMLYLRLVDGDTIGEIAAVVGLDDKTVWRRLHKGERELFSHLPG